MAEKKFGLRNRLRKKYNHVGRGFILLLLTVFQFFSTLPVIFSDGTVHFSVWGMFIAYNVFEWVYIIFSTFFTLSITFKLDISFQI